jgi:hypothetical protein
VLSKKFIQIILVDLVSFHLEHTLSLLGSDESFTTTVSRLDPEGVESSERLPLPLTLAAIAAIFVSLLVR